MSEFDGKVAVVTGASSGIGRSAAELLAVRGARVAIFARSAEKLDAIAARHRERMLAVSGDVADLAAVERLFATVESRFGHCDVLVNNAGMIDPAALIDTTLDQWAQMFAVNVRGA